MKKVLIVLFIVAIVIFGLLKILEPYFEDLKIFSEQNDNIYNTGPLVLDLNNDGKISFIDINSSKIFFDLTGDGMGKYTAWIGKEDGMLTYDINNNKKIDNINELFGNFQTNGFDDLKDRMDSNKDSVINQFDENFNKLQVWQDLNQDGIAQENELFSLSELGTSEIRIKNKTTKDNGSITRIVREGIFIKGNKKCFMADVNLEYNPAMTNYTADVNLTLEMLTLPFLRGYGTVKDLHVMYTLDESLLDMVRDMSDDISYAKDNFELFLAKWTGLEKLKNEAGLSLNSSLNYDDKVWMLESIMGQNVFKDSVEAAIKKGANTNNRYDTAYIDTHFKILKDKYYNDFMLQAYVFNYPKSGAYYSVSDGGLVVNDSEVLKKTLTNSKETIEKLGIDYFEIYDKTKKAFVIYVINEKKRDELTKTSEKFVVPR